MSHGESKQAIAKLIDVGSGDPILIIPGIQGRWEWMRPAVDALSPSYRVLAFSLDVVPPDEGCFERWHEYIDALLDAKGVERVTLVGVSFGGIIASRYALRTPSRVAGLVLVSVPAPDFDLGPKLEAYLKRPTLSLPAYGVRVVGNLLPEAVASQPTWPRRLGFIARHFARSIRYPASPSLMVAWIKAWKNSEPAGVSVPRAGFPTPTLVITGEPTLDRVVPVASTLEYLNLIPHARHHVLQRTGHFGMLSTPETFARVVGEFQRELAAPAATQ